MSIERSYRACNMCHKYNTRVDEILKGVEGDEDELREDLKDLVAGYRQLRDQANFEAMRALELGIRNTHSPSFTQFDETQTVVNFLKKTLRECATCDYSTPRVADMLKKHIEPGDEEVKS